MSYPIGDLILLFGAITLWFLRDSGILSKCLAFLTTGLSIQVIADSLYSWQQINETYISGNIIETLYSPVLLLIGFSGYYFKIEYQEANPEPKKKQDQRRSIYFSIIVPNLLVLGLFVFLIYSHSYTFDYMIFALFAVFLLVARQVAVLLENNRLLHRYMKKTQELNISDQRYRSLFEFNFSAVFSIDLNGSFTSVNQTALKLLGYTEEELMQSSIFSISTTENEEEIAFHFNRGINGEVYKFEMVIQRKEKDQRTVLFTTTPIKVEEQLVGLYILADDITENKRNEEKITHMAFHDLLTGLPNRRMFELEIEKALNEYKENGCIFGIMFIDLDRFKVINDTLGHKLGDEIIIAVSKRLREVLRPADMVSRQGGDEFTYVIRAITEIEEIKKIAEDVLYALSKPYRVESIEMNITPSIGVAVYPDGGRTVEDLMKNADTAMYQAKENGKNTYYIFEKEKSQIPSRRLILENDLYKAIERNELVVYYQPQIDYPSRQIIGVEALIRWNHSKLGLVPPSEFIPIAEESGLILPIGEWILWEACTQVKKWNNLGFPIKVGVNLSPRQFKKKDAITCIKRLLDKTGLDPANLDLEITEGIAMNSVDIIIPLLKNLREMGIKISVDDFGTGYSSLAYLSNFPIDTLKIAREFIDKVGKDPGNEAVIASIISLASHLNLSVIAEGVETMEQAQFLSSLDCRSMQGYLFGKPVPGEVMEKLLLEKSKAG
ncbi:putative bifunctional diguanylate cyclase/phosphodiesterase [Peribacillus kribbensis]|uniref:putative bifunctional diguanylate cyclase/phosphodiesterase n=1 Tax=Peribacillus kribbensis TaxID=356658 RepID=UPI001FE0038F|nr:EAL domain-containing protein [Peribacillus kribbensis]